MASNSETVVVAYIPVLHQGYVVFLQKHCLQRRLFLVGTEITASFRPLVKDIRVVEPHQMAIAITSLNLAKSVEVLGLAELSALVNDQAVTTMVMPDEQVMREIVEQYVDKKNIEWYQPFLRWDSQKSTTPQPVKPDHVLSNQEFDQTVMARAQRVAAKSADWWRQVGAILVATDGEILISAYNQHQPTEQQPYQDGDPRADFHKGDHIELSTAIHAEAAVIAKAASQGVTTQDCSLYVTTFPCPVCAKLIAAAGIATLFYSEGYALLDGQTVLTTAGIDIIQVK